MAPFNMGESGKLMKNLLNNIDVFNGQKSRFEDWVTKTTICFEHCYPLIAEIINGKEKPPEVIGYRSLTDQRGPSRTTLQRGVGGRLHPHTTSTSGGVHVGPPSASAGEVESQASPTSTADTFLAKRNQRVPIELLERQQRRHGQRLTLNPLAVTSRRGCCRCFPHPCRHYWWPRLERSGQRR